MRRYGGHLETRRYTRLRAALGWELVHWEIGYLRSYLRCRDALHERAAIVGTGVVRGEGVGAAGGRSVVRPIADDGI